MKQAGMQSLVSLGCGNEDIFFMTSATMYSESKRHWAALKRIEVKIKAC